MSSKDVIILKELFEEKFKGLHIQMDAEFKVLNERINSNVEILERVEEQTKKTNGRVTVLEKADILHINDCPNTKRITAVEDNLSEYNIIKKYPKVSIGVISFVVIAFMIGVYTTVSRVKINTRAVNTNTQTVTTNTEAIHQSDSLLINQ